MIITGFLSKMSTGPRRALTADMSCRRWCAPNIPSNFIRIAYRMAQYCTLVRWNYLHDAQGSGHLRSCPEVSTDLTQCSIKVPKQVDNYAASTHRPHQSSLELPHRLYIFE